MCPKEETLKGLALQFTTECNQSCIMCGQYHNRMREVSPSSYISLSQLRKAFKKGTLMFKSIYCWGGEPLLHPDFVGLCWLLRYHTFSLTVNTNGAKGNYLVEMIRSGVVDLAVISMEGPKDVNDQVRGKGAFQQAMATLRRLLEIDPERVRVNVTITAHNLYYLPEFLYELSLLGVVKVSLQLPLFVVHKLGIDYEREAFRLMGLRASSWRGFSHTNLKLPKGNAVLQVFNSLQSFPNLRIIHFPACARPSSFYERYFNVNPDTISKEFVQCKFVNNNLALRADGMFVLCPDFPDVPIGSLNNMQWQQACSDMKKTYYMLSRGGKMGICYRCCHNNKIAVYSAEDRQISSNERSELGAEISELKVEYRNEPKAKEERRSNFLGA